jgi:predicted O-linked N-acetylglucosamine transferase (SPINDLY family)
MSRRRSQHPAPHGGGGIRGRHQGGTAAAANAASNSCASLLQQALLQQQRGLWSEAEALCRQALRLQGNHFGALTLTGVLLAQTGRAAQAAPLLERAVGVARHDAAAHNNYGNVLRELRRYAQAVASYERALAIRADYVEAHYNRALALHELGHFEAALAGYEQALALRPDYALAHGNRGASLRQLGRHLDALQSYTRALELQPDNAAAHNNLGVALQQLERLQDAMASYQRALALEPHYPEALRNRGSVLYRLGSLQAACASYREALAQDPEDAIACTGLGATLHRARDFEGARQSYQRAVAIDAAHAEAHYNFGNLLRELGQLELALDSYRRALAVRPGYSQAWENQGATLQQLGRFAEAEDSFAQALQLDPLHPWLYGYWLSARMQLCDWRDLDAHLSVLLARIADGERAAAPFTAVTIADAPRLQRRAAETWVRDIGPQTPQLPPIVRRSAGERIRIGYYSADYHVHATAVLAEELFRCHDRRQFELVAFHFGTTRRDAMTAHLSTAFERFIEVHERSDLQIAELSRELQIDIAVDLKGFTQDQRAGIFAHRAAPLQVNYLGFPGTMGAPYIDYLVADATLIAEQERHWYTEKIAYLPHSYQVNGRSRPIAEDCGARAQHGLPAQGVVFCCFNNPYKITPAVFAVWMRLLQRVPGSVLWLLDGGEVACANLRSAAQAQGVDAHRLVFAARLPLPQHLGRHAAADLFLDTLPCNAHTTASDALWAGLPVVTCAGDSFASRVAASALAAIGLPELITRTLAHYEQLLLELATQPARLAALRTRLAHNRLTTPLFDIERYTRHLESAYRQMYERYQADLPPEHLFITA